MKKIIISILFFVFAFSALSFAEEQGVTPNGTSYTIYEGVLNEAPYKILVPDNWNRDLLLYAHGYGYIERYDENQFNSCVHFLCLKSGRSCFFGCAAFEFG